LTKIKIGIVLLLLKKNRFENRRPSCAIKITNTFFSFFFYTCSINTGREFLKNQIIGVRLQILVPSSRITISLGLAKFINFFSKCMASHFFSFFGGGWYKCTIHHKLLLLLTLRLGEPKKDLFLLKNF
jgi:hypothetical protein